MSQMQNLKRIQRELKEFNAESQMLNCTGGPMDGNMTKWLVVLSPPSTSMYHGANIKFQVDFPEGYPLTAPNISIQTKLFHPNVDGDKICIEMIKKDYAPTTTIKSVFYQIIQMLDEPNCGTPLNHDAAKLYDSDKPKFMETVQKWINDYAK